MGQITRPIGVTNKGPLLGPGKTQWPKYEPGLSPRLI
jgi:hypothetical protein